MAKPATTTIRLRRSTKRRLDRRRRLGETYDELLNRLLDPADAIRRRPLVGRELGPEPPNLPPPPPGA